MLIGGPGVDVLDGGDGDDVEIQLVASIRIIDGETVLDVGGETRTLPNADLSRLVRNALTH